MATQTPTRARGEPREVPRATKAEFEDAVKAGGPFVLIDARSGPAYQSSHLDLKHAIRIQPGTTTAHLAEIPGGCPIFTVCT